MRVLTGFLASVGLQVLVGAPLLVAGCGSDDDLDLSQLPVASEDGKADATPGGRLFTWIRPLAAEINCVRAPCSTHMIYDLNLGQFEPTYAYDWRAMKLSSADQQKMEANESRTLFYGQYASAKVQGETVKVFQVTRINPRVSEQSIDSPDTDRYYTLRAGTASCPQSTCQGYTATLMNRFQAEQWSNLDISRLGLGPQTQQALLLDLQNGKAYASARNVSDMPVVLTEVFRSYDAPPLP